MFESEDPLGILEVHLYENGSVDVYGISTYKHPLYHNNIEGALVSIKDYLEKTFKENYCDE